MVSRIQIVQMNPLVGDVAGNAERLIAESLGARDAGADLVVFPELALTGYPPEDLLLRPEFIARVESALARILSAPPVVVSVHATRTRSVVAVSD